MLKSILLGLSALAVAGPGYFGVTASTAKAEEPKVICCGECEPADDCLKRCSVVGDVPKAHGFRCCGKCESGEDCLKQCAPAKRSCCEAN